MIRSREDAIATLNGAAVVFLLVAALMAGFWLLRGERTLLTMGLFGVFGVLVWKFRSPAAAFVLLLSAVMLLLFTVAQIADTGEVDWRYVAVGVVVLFASIRAVEATLKLVGRFAADEPGAKH
ncbi:MAG TPA: hypothetical protein VHB46_15770 [Burkholderiales bacterium]|nr:hypothetical protein [Burkholderiales bacterium]